MPESATDDRPGASGRKTPLGSLSAHYAPGQERPLGSYAILAGAYSTGLAGSLIALRARRRQLPERPTVTDDLLLVGIATHKISRLVAKDKVTSFIRAPFTRFQDQAGHGPVRGAAVRPRATPRHRGGPCVPLCLAQWVATALTLGYVGPRASHAYLSSAVRRAHNLRLPAGRLPRRRRPAVRSGKPRTLRLAQERRSAGVDDATRRALLGFVIPLWIGVGFADWLCHRHSDIEHTAGKREG